MTYVDLLSSKSSLSPRPESYTTHFLEYEALCSTLGQCLQKKELLLEKSAERRLIETTYEMNQYLLNTYEHINIDSNVLKSLSQQAAYLAQLLPPMKKNSAMTPSLDPVKTTLNNIRTKTSLWNPTRLLFSRCKRLLANCFPVLYLLTEQARSEKWDAALIVLKTGDIFLGRILNILSWLFLLPRLVANLFGACWHSLSPKTEKEKCLSLKQRLGLQLRERWFELANDVVWVPGSLLTCFLLVGAWSFIGIYLSLALFTWDVITAGIRAYHSLNCLSHLIKNHHKQHASLTGEDQQIHRLFLNALERQYAYEKKRQILSLSNATLVTLFSMFALATFPLHFALPIVASIGLVAIGIGNLLLNKRLLTSKPINPFSSSNLPVFQRTESTVSSLPGLTEGSTDILSRDNLPDIEGTPHGSPLSPQIYNPQSPNLPRTFSRATSSPTSSY